MMIHNALMIGADPRDQLDMWSTSDADALQVALQEPTIGKKFGYIRERIVSCLNDL